MEDTHHDYCHRRIFFATTTMLTCCHCGVMALQNRMTVVPKSANVLKKLIQDYNLTLTVRPGTQYICKEHISNGPRAKITCLPAQPSTSNSLMLQEEVKQEEIEEESAFVDPWLEPKQEQVDEVSYDDFPFELEENSYETYEGGNDYSYQQNNYAMDSEPTTSTETATNSRNARGASVLENTLPPENLSDLQNYFEELTDDQIMSFCVKTSSNLSGYSSFECGMCSEQYFQTPDTRPIRYHLEIRHSIAVNNFIQTGQAPFAPKTYAPVSRAIKAKADESLCKFFIKNGLPLQTVHDLNLEMLTFNMNSSYKLPTMDRLSGLLKEIALSKTDKKLTVEGGPVTVAFDITTFENRHYLAFTVHYYHDTNQNKRIVFFREFKMTKSATSSIMSTIKNAMDESNIRLPITTIVTGKSEYEDALENMDSFKQVMVCFSENLNRFAESLILYPVFLVSLKKLRGFIQKLPANRKDWSRFKTYVVRKRTSGEYPEIDGGHWITTLDFITKCLHMHRLFSEFTTSNPHIPYITVTDNVNMVYLHSLLNLCKNAFKTISEPRASVADVIPVITTLRESLHVTTSSQIVIDGVNLIFNRLLHPFIEQSDVHRFAVFLHPLRHGSEILSQSDWNMTKMSLVRHIAQREATEGAPLSKTGKFVSFATSKGSVTAEKEVVAFCTYVVRLTGVETEPVDWWTRHASRFPRLYKYAIEIYQIPPCTIDASYFLGDYGLLTYSLNETDASKKKMLLEAASELVEYRAKSELMYKQICVKRKRDGGCPDDMWYNPIDFRALQSCDPVDVKKRVEPTSTDRQPATIISSAIANRSRFVMPKLIFPQRPPYIAPSVVPRTTFQLGKKSLPIQKPFNTPASHPYSRRVVIASKQVGKDRPIKTEDGFSHIPSSSKKYFAVKTIPNNGPRMIRKMNGEIVKVVSKPQTPVTVSVTKTVVPNIQGKKIYFVRSKTGVTHQIQNPP